MAKQFPPGGLLLRALFVCSLVVITAASLLPSSGTMSFPMQDKVLHLGAYLFLYCFGCYSFSRSATVRSWNGRLVVGLVIYGIAIELLQGLTGYRDRDPWDVLANIVGVALGLGFMSLFSRWQQTTSQPE